MPQPQAKPRPRTQAKYHIDLAPLEHFQAKWEPVRRRKCD
jgi:hypothetical protein